MPSVDQLMQEWPTGFEDLLKKVCMSHWNYHNDCFLHCWVFSCYVDKAHHVVIFTIVQLSCIILRLADCLQCLDAVRWVTEGHLD